MRRTPIALATVGGAFALLAPALAAGGTTAGGGLSLSPAILEHAADPGSVGSVTIANGTGRQLRITVRARPWKQSRSGATTPDRRRTLRGVRLSASRFTLAPGASRTVSMTLRRRPSGGSAYGAIEVVGKPKRRRRGITANYRLIGSLRLTPSAARRRLRLRAGGVRVDRSRRQVVMRVRNTGNTVEPVTGTARISGSRGARHGSVTAVRIVPGKSVDVGLASSRGLARGSYTATVRLSQAGRTVVSANRRFRVR
jgi:hypothetical protein